MLDVVAPDAVFNVNTGAAPALNDRALISLDYVSELREAFRQRDEMYRMIEEVIFLQQAVRIPDAYKNSAVEVRSPLPTHIANQITAAMSVNAPRITFRPIQFGDVGENEAAFRSRFFEASWMRQQREKKRRLHRLFMYSVITKGEGILKTFERKNRAWAKYTDYSKQLLKELDKQVANGEIDHHSRTTIWDAATEEYKRGQPYPIETTEVPPETFYYQKGEDGFVRIAEIKAVPYLETLLKYGASLNEKGQVIAFDDVTRLPLPSEQWGQVFARSSTIKTLEMVELWDVEYCRIILRGPGDIAPAGSNRSGAGLLVKEWKHGYGDKNLGVLRGPYFHAPGILTSSREPHKAHLSVLFAYLHLFPLLNSLLTMQSQAAFSFAYPAYRRTTAPAFSLPDHPFGFDAVDQQAARERIIPGSIFPHDVAPMDQPRTSVDLDKAISFVRSLIDMSLPDSVQGVITGETAGYTLNQASHLAGLAWTPIIDNVQDTLSERVGWESALIEEKIGEPVYVWGAVPQPKTRQGQPTTYKDGWMGIGPQQLKGVHNYEVELKAASVNNDMLELRVLREELDMRLISPNEAIRKRGRNPVDVEREWFIYELKQDPEIRQNMKQRIFQGLSTIDQESMRKVGPEGQPGGAPPVETSGMPAGAQPGVSQGLPVTGFVPPAGVPPAQPAPALPPPMAIPRPPGTPAGAPSGVPNPPQAHEPLPGGG